MSKQNPLVLIVEDVESNYLYLQAVLTKITNNVVWVENGVDAVKYVKENAEIDIILMDLQMPEMNGYEATKQIKALFPAMTIIAQTAFAMSDDKERAMEAGCDDYLAKPIRSKDLLETVQKYLDKKESK